MTNTENELNTLKSQYCAIKFRYLCLKQEQEFKYFKHFEQTKQAGGYTESSPTHLAAAAIAVINCTYFGTNQESVDCTKPIDNTQEKINIIKNELLTLENVSGIKAINRKRELNVELDKLKTIRTEINKPNINNRTCDTTLATVASIYLSIIFHTDKDKFMLLFNDLINAKINNCEVAQKTEEKKYEIIEYFLNSIEKMNNYLSLINKPNNVNYEDIFTNAEYGKQDKKMVEKLKEKGLSISKDDEENFRMINEFIGSNLDKVNIIDLNYVVNNIKSASDNNKNTLIKKYINDTFTNQIKNPINVDNFIVFGVYTYDKKIIIKNPITHKERKDKKLFV
jgi:hypothetical protein